MTKSFFCRDEEVTTNVALHVMTRSEIPDMAGSDIPNMAGRKTRRKRTQAVTKCYRFHGHARSQVNGTQFPQIDLIQIAK